MTITTFMLVLAGQSTVGPQAAIGVAADVDTVAE